MLKFSRIIFIILVLSILTIGIVHAQDDVCPQIVSDALTAVDSSCSGIGRNQACYGNFSIEAHPQPDVTNLVFNQEGDIADLNDIQGFTLKGMDTSTGEWGVAMLSVQANLPDATPGANVTFLMFGDVVMEQAPNSPSPMQSFYFQNGIGDAACKEAPPNGILVQTPEGVTQVALTINGVNIAVGSTAFIQANPPSEEDVEGTMTVNLLEGQATMGPEDGDEADAVVISAGEFSTIELDEELAPVGVPSEPEAYDPAAFDALPVRLLEREIEIASLVEDAEATEEASSGSIAPLSGTWLYETSALEFSADCPGAVTSSMSSMMPQVSETQVQDWETGFTVENYEKQMQVLGEPLPAGATITQVDENTIRIEMSQDGATVVIEARVVSETLIHASVVMSITQGMSCTITIPTTMTYQGE